MVLLKVKYWREGGVKYTAVSFGFGDLGTRGCTLAETEDRSWVEGSSRVGVEDLRGMLDESLPEGKRAKHREKVEENLYLDMRDVLGEAI